MKAMTVRSWIELLAIVGAIACALALSIATLGAAGAAAAEEPESGQAAQSSAVQPETYEGMITDTHCGAKHSAATGKTAGDCTRACVHGGERFSLVNGDKVYVLEGEPAALKRVAGQRVRIVGSLRGNTISVTSVATSVSKSHEDPIKPHLQSSRVQAVATLLTGN
jgi:hypothetical protein